MPALTTEIGRKKRKSVRIFYNLLKKIYMLLIPVDSVVFHGAKVKIKRVSS
jgi:hypothetical protein